MDVEVRKVISNITISLNFSEFKLRERYRNRSHEVRRLILECVSWRTEARALMHRVSRHTFIEMVTTVIEEVGSI